MPKNIKLEIFASILVLLLFIFPASTSFSSNPKISNQSKIYVCPYPCLPPTLPIPVNCPPPPVTPPLPPGPPLPPPLLPLRPPLPPGPPLPPQLPPGPPLPPPFPYPPGPWPTSAPPPPNPILPYFPWYYKNPPPPPDYASANRLEVFPNLLMAPCMLFLALFSLFF